MKTNKLITINSEANITMKTIDRTSSQILDSTSSVMTSNNQKFIWFSLNYNHIDFASYSSLKLRFRQSNQTSSDIILYKSNDRYMITAISFKTTKVLDNGIAYLEIDILKQIIDNIGQTLYFAFYIEGSSQTELSLYTDNSAYTPKIVGTYIKNDFIKNQKYVSGTNNGTDNYLINARNGKLEYFMNLFNTYSEHLGTNLSISYNEVDTFTSSVNGFPIGWKLNYYQYIKTSGSEYLYYDENNHVHTFVLANNLTSSSTEKIYYDKDNSYMTLKVNTNNSNAVFTINVDQSQKLEFNSSGLLVKIIKQTSANYQHEITNTYDSNHRLTSITDASGLTTTISYDTTNKTITIVKPNSKTITLQYDSNNCMTSITNNSKTTSFYYKTIVLSGLVLPRAVDASKKYYLLTDIVSEKYKNSFTYIGDSKKITKATDYIYNGSSFIIDKTTIITYNHTYSKVGIHPLSQSAGDASSYILYYYNVKGECVKAEERSSNNVVLSYVSYLNNNGIIYPFKPKYEFSVYGDYYNTSCDYGQTIGYLFLDDPIYFDEDKKLGYDPIEYKTLIKYSFEQKSSINVSSTTTDSYIEILDKRDNVLTSVKLNPSNDYNNEIILYFKTNLAYPKVRITNNDQNYKINIEYVDIFRVNDIESSVLFNFNNGDTLAEVESSNYYKYDNVSLKYTYNNQTTTLNNIEFSFNDLMTNKENFFRAKKSGNSTYNIFYNDGQNMLSNVSDVKYVFNESEKTIQDFKFLIFSGNEYFYCFKLIDYNFDANNYQRIIINSNKSKEYQSTTTFKKQEIDDYGNVIKDINEEGRINEYNTNNKGHVYQIISYFINEPENKMFYTISYNNNRISSENEYYIRSSVGSKYEYDTMGKITKFYNINETTPLVNYTYDTLTDNNLTNISFPKTTNNENHTITYQNDNISQISKNNTIFSYLYDYRNNVTQVKIGNDTYCTISYNYDAVNPSKTIIYANNEQERITYNKLGQVDKVERKKSNETEFSELYHNNYTTSHEYLYSDSKLHQTTFPNNKCNYYWFDYYDRPENITIEDVKTTYEYDFNIIEYGNLYTIVTNSTTYINEHEVKKEQRACSKIEQVENYPTYIYDCHVLFDDVKTYVEQIYLDEFSRRKKDYLYVETGHTCQYLNEYEYAYYNSVNEKILSNFINKQNFSINNKYLSSSSETVSQETIHYTYDSKGNINSIASNHNNVSYEYDSYNNLIRENNYKLGKTFYYTYDNNGNVLSKTIFAFTTNPTLTTPIQVINYQYSNDGKNKLLSYDGKTIAYNNMMQPTSINNYELKWEFGKLTQYANFTFSYDKMGRRITKTTNNKSTVYIYEQDKLLKQIFPNGEELFFIYGTNGVVGCRHTKDGVTNNYAYQKNILGDIIAIYYTNSEGVSVLKARYIYDAWGNHQVLLYNSQSEAEGTSIGEINPFRYRGYYYDVETQLFYCNSRYYSPELCRFISPDSIEYLDPQSINGLNLYCYCMNNPIMYADPSGHLPEWAAWLISGAAIVGGIVLCATGVGGILGGVLIGAGAGSLINGYVTEANGGDFTAGYIGGAISGALCGVGAGLGGMAFAAASEVANLACIGYMALGVTASFAGGFAGNLAGTVYTSWHNSGFKSVDIDWGETLATSAIMGSLNILAGMGSAMSSIAGSMGRVATDVNSKFALRFLAGLIAGGTEAAYDLTSYLIGKLISAF